MVRNEKNKARACSQFPSNSTQTARILGKIFYWAQTETGRRFPQQISTSQSSKSKASCRRRPHRAAASGANWGLIRRSPTRSPPAVTTWGVWRELMESTLNLIKNKNKTHNNYGKHTQTCGWPRWWMISWVLIFPGHPVVAKRFSLARDHLERKTKSWKPSHNWRITVWNIKSSSWNWLVLNYESFFCDANQFRSL